VIEELKRLLDEVGVLQSKLILIIGPPNAGKTALLRALARGAGTVPLNVGAELSRRLASLPQKQRLLQTPIMLRELADQHAAGDLLLMDNIELLFDRSLHLEPLDLLKRHAHVKRVVAVWPGELQGDRLIYATLAHPEHRNYGIEGLVPFEIQ
jgi:predicted ATPase